MYDFNRDNKYYEKFNGKVIKTINQIDSGRIFIEFDDDTHIAIFNNGIINEDIHLKIREI